MRRKRIKKQVAQKQKQRQSVVVNINTKESKGRKGRPKAPSKAPSISPSISTSFNPVIHLPHFDSPSSIIQSLKALDHRQADVTRDVSRAEASAIKNKNPIPQPTQAEIIRDVRQADIAEETLTPLRSRILASAESRNIPFHSGLASQEFYQVLNEPELQPTTIPESASITIHPPLGERGLHTSISRYPHGILESQATSPFSEPIQQAEAQATTETEYRPSPIQLKKVYPITAETPRSIHTSRLFGGKEESFPPAQPYGSLIRETLQAEAPYAQAIEPLEPEPLEQPRLQRAYSEQDLFKQKIKDHNRSIGKSNPGFIHLTKEVTSKQGKITRRQKTPDELRQEIADKGISGIL